MELVKLFSPKLCFHSSHKNNKCKNFQTVDALPLKNGDFAPTYQSIIYSFVQQGELVLHYKVMPSQGAMSTFDE